MNSLAIPRDKPLAVESPSEDRGPTYPSLTLRDECVKKFTDGARLEPGKIYTCPIEFKVEGWSDREYGKSLDLCVLSSGDIEEVGEAEEKGKEDDDVLVAIGFKGGKEKKYAA